ncbi:MAG: ketose-bisphosphate aldolase [Clostridiales bacterium]|jgi:tagatose 1,6-diphosphate aldolase GatY/KbaY|nr:ketose-bisphosphate aldolase [Clostridiales bacterium]
MKLVPALDLILEAQKNKKAVAAFNVENMETVQAVVRASFESNTPVIIQTTPSSVKYAGLAAFYHNVLAALEQIGSDVLVALHLDHGSSFDLAVKAIRHGYSSVMIDGSLLSFEENVALTQQVVAAAAPVGVSVEAELGNVGGKEDDLETEKNNLTDPAQAAEFAERTGTSTLAVAIGTAHGIYAGEPKLDLARLKEIRAAVKVPLILHGTSGVPDETVKQCITIGMSKVNYATDLRVAFSDAVKKAIAEKPDGFDPKHYLGAGREAVYKRAMALIQVCNN